MTITKTVEQNRLTLALAGRLDTVTAPGFEQELDASLGAIDLLILDFSNLNYISSAGLRVLLKAQKLMNEKGSMKVIGVNETIMEVFEITGFSDILTIE